MGLSPTRIPKIRSGPTRIPKIRSERTRNPAPVPNDTVDGRGLDGVARQEGPSGAEVGALRVLLEEQRRTAVDGDRRFKTHPADKSSVALVEGGKMGHGSVAGQAARNNSVSKN